MDDKIDITTLTPEQIKQHLNLETGKLNWQELSRHFARGVVLIVDTQLDLIDVATKMVVDDKDSIAVWLDTQQLLRPEDEHAQQWQDNSTEFWSVVVAPWVLVQEISIQ